MGGGDAQLELVAEQRASRLAGQGQGRSGNSRDTAKTDECQDKGGGGAAGGLRGNLQLMWVIVCNE